ncbi:MAG: hypothetical protein IT365_19785 [Candidatus Hydrogenedentes bacterium]|nr:hypothetical protein [Candidatus Hydrogenedentota bacterium]
MRMKRIAVCAACLLTAGCIPLSLNPLYTDDDLVYDAGLEGTWGEAPEQWAFEKAGENEYLLKVSEDEGRTTEFSVHLVQLKKHRFLDLQLSDRPDLSEWEMLHVIPAHTFWAFERDGDTLRLRNFDPEWLEDRVKNDRLWVPHTESNDFLVLTAGTKRLQRFMLKWADDEEAMGDWEEMKRAPAK